MFVDGRRLFCMKVRSFDTSEAGSPACLGGFVKCSKAEAAIIDCRVQDGTVTLPLERRSSSQLGEDQRTETSFADYAGDRLSACGQALKNDNLTGADKISLASVAMCVCEVGAVGVECNMQCRRAERNAVRCVDDAR